MTNTTQTHIMQNNEKPTRDEVEKYDHFIWNCLVFLSQRTWIGKTLFFILCNRIESDGKENKKFMKKKLI